MIQISDKEKDYLELNKEVKTAKEPKDAISLVKKYEERLIGANRNIINVMGKEGELHKKFKERNEFFSRVGLS